MTTKNRNPPIKCKVCGKISTTSKPSCAQCRKKEKALSIILECKASIKTPNFYNKYLFDLYLEYMSNCVPRMYYGYQAQALKKVLEENLIPVIRSWGDIYLLSDKYCLYEKGRGKCGCAFKKIGRMLQGLKVIDHPGREGRCLKRIRSLEKKLNQENKWVMLYIQKLAKIKRSLRTQVVHLEQIVVLQKWLEKQGYGQAFRGLNTSLAESYLHEYKVKKRSHNQLYADYCNLRKFYSWGTLEGYLDENPFQKVTVRIGKMPLRHCSDTEIQQLHNYIKNPSSCSESALLILLIVFLGLTREELTYSELVETSDGFYIQLERKPLTAGKKVYRKDAVQQIPNTPLWLKDLKKRYLTHWTKLYQKSMKIYAHKPLLLTHGNKCSLYLSSKTMDDRIKKAASLALGNRGVSYKILRNTCAYMYSKDNDGSILSRFGWAPESIPDIVYREKVVYRSSK